MNEHIEKLLTEFKDNEAIFIKMKEIVIDYLNKMLVKNNKVLLAGLEGRVKTYDSLKGKLTLKGHKYKTIKDITDLFGARIITFYNDEVDLIASFIERYFDIDYDNSIDKRKMYGVDTFGYMSLHYVCKIPKDIFYDEKLKEINEFRFEIQIRTCLQHVWATIFHDIGYKTDIEVPKKYIRQLSRLEGLLEIADDEFYNIREEIKNYRGKIHSLFSKGDFRDILLDIDSYNSYLAIDPYRELINKIASINNAEVEEVSYSKYYKIFIDLGIKSIIELEKMRVDNTEDAYKLSLIQLGNTDIDIISSTIAIQNILIMYIIKKKGSRDDIKNLLLKTNSFVSDAYVDKLIEQTKGIVML